MAFLRAFRRVVSPDPGAVMLLFLAAAMPIACSSENTESSGASSIDTTRTLGSLTNAERATLCDWENGLQGGYGRSVACDDGTTVMADTDQATCLEDFSRVTCSATVGNYENCARWHAQDPCGNAVLLVGERLPADCVALEGCFPLDAPASQS